MPYRIVRDDITKMNTDAIVNAANTGLKPGGGVCGAIFEAAGYEKLERACAKIGACPTGSAVITKGYNLPAKYIIHTPGPVYRGGNHGEAELLRSCYTSCLELAAKRRLRSVAFPLISAGIYGYPKGEALRIAADAITEFLEDHEMNVYMVVFDKNSFEISAKLYNDVREYIEDALVNRIERAEARLRRSKPLAEEELDLASTAPISLSEIGEELDKTEDSFKPNTTDFTFFTTVECHTLPKIKPSKAEIEKRLKNMDKSFSQRLLDLIDESGMTDVQVYKKANIDRKLFSKIRSNPQYKPGKITALAFALALELDMRETRDLIGRAGYALTRSNKFDIIIEYFITRGIYNIFEINEVLFAFDQPLIGA